MASLVESGLTNIQGGDADSVGFFQMRVGIWNQGEYAGYPKKPELQVKWFLDQAEQVKKQRVAAGEPIDDPNSFGEWIADVERPAEQYRGRYQLKLGEANDLLGSAATAPPAAAAAAPAPGAAAAAADAADAPKKDRGDEMQFMAAKAEAAKEAAHKHRATVQFMKAVDPKQAGAAGAPAAGPQVAAAAAAAPATGPTAAEDAAANQAVGAPVPEGELALQNVGAIGTYPGDSASQAELAQWLASEAKKAGLPPELPVMASLVESGREEPQGRRRRLRRLLPDARRHLGQRALQGLPHEPAAPGQVVHRQRAPGQEGAPRGRQVRHRPRVVRRVDRRHRAPGRAVPLQVPAAPRPRRAS